MATNPSLRILVTGGNRGIGLAIARGLAAQGCTVIATARTLASAEQAARSLPGDVTPLELDVSDDRSIAQAVETVRQQGDRLDGLINNAGINPPDDRILAATRDSLNTAMQANTFGVIQLVQACLPLLEKSPAARIVNVSSGAGAIADLSSGMPSYSLSKLALNGATRLLAEALQPQGIAVNAMCPGWVRTDMGGSAAPRSPEQGADTAIWLATEAPQRETGKFWRDRAEISF